MRKIDLNADMGESFGAYTIGDDKALLQIVSSANIACGFHGGDPSIMEQTVREAAKNGVRIGAHPGFNDLAGFGRRVIRGDSPEAVGQMILYQVGALQAITRANDCSVSYVKLHGSLSNMASVEPPLAEAYASAMARLDNNFKIMAMPLSAVETAARNKNLSIIHEVFADRTYQDDGMLTPRSQQGSVIHDKNFAAERVLRMIEDEALTSVSGNKIPVEIDSICVHGDNPQAIHMASHIRETLEKAGITVGV